MYERSFYFLNNAACISIAIFIQASMTLDITDERSVMLFMHNKNHALLDFSDAFGGTYISVPTGMVARWL